MLKIDCFQKHTYLSEASGLKELKRVKKARKLRNYSTIQVYFCSNCGLWHLGHNNRRRIVKVQ